MNLIQKITLKQYCKNKTFNQIIEQCLQFKELNEYLNCLDLQAELMQDDFISPDNMIHINKLKHNENTLLAVIQSKIVEIVLLSGIKNTDALYNAALIQEMLGDEDSVSEEYGNRQSLYKIYIICKEMIRAFELIGDQRCTIPCNYFKK